MTDAERAILTELRAVNTRIAALASEVRAGRSRGRKRAKSRVTVLAAADRPMDPQPTELDMARARKYLRDHR